MSWMKQRGEQAGAETSARKNRCTCAIPCAHANLLTDNLLSRDEERASQAERPSQSRGKLFQRQAQSEEAQGISCICSTTLEDEEF